MMHRPPTNLLKRSHITAGNMVVPMLTSATSSHLLEGPYLLASFNDEFYGLPPISRQPIQTSLIEHPASHISKSYEQDDEPARKKRLTVDQTKSLECSFAVDSKLEPEKKNKLALELGLQPRQVAIWYQNRRARTKTKHLEEKYDALQMQYQGVLEEKRKLEAEVIKLREQLGLQGKVKLGGKEVKTVVEKKQEAVTSTSNYTDYCNKPSQGAALSRNKEVAAFPTGQQPPKGDDTEGGDGEETLEEAEAESEDISCATAQNELALDANSPASDCTFYQVNNTTKLGTETETMYPYVQQQEVYDVDHRVLNFNNHHHQQQQQQQQHQLLQQIQHQYNLSSFIQFVSDVKLENEGHPAHPTALVAQVDDHLFNDYRFNLEDQTASLYFDLATQA